MTDHELESVIRSLLRNHSSPTVGRGDIHGDQPGFIIYEPNIGFVVAGIRRFLQNHAVQPAQGSPRKWLSDVFGSADWAALYVEGKEIANVCRKDCRLISSRLADGLAEGAETEEQLRASLDGDLVKQIEEIIYGDASISHFDNDSEVDNAAYLARTIVALIRRQSPAETGHQVTWDDADVQERCAKIAEFFSDGAHIAHDMNSGRFPKRSHVRDAIAEKIRQMSLPARTQSGCSSEALALQGRLLRVITTAQNDDLSEPRSDKRDRHVERQETLRDVAEFLGRCTQPESTGLVSVWESLPLETKKAIRDESWDLVECIMKLVSRDRNTGE